MLVLSKVLLMNIISIMSLIVVGICATLCMGKTIDAHPVNTQVLTHSIEETITMHAEELMSMQGVVGVGQGLCDNTPCIKVYITRSTPELNNKIPALLEGYKVSVEITGEIRAHPDN